MIPILTIFCCTLYGVFLLWCRFHWNKIRSISNLFWCRFYPNQIKSISNSSEINTVTVAIIVPVRNEATNILNLLEDISKQDYRLFELILADDHSTDMTNVIAQEWISSHPEIKAQCVKTNGGSKKDAITHAINLTGAELIVTTDADCRMSRVWISTLINYYLSEHSFLLSAPVIMNDNGSVTGKIQAAEYAGLMAIGAAAIASGHPMFCSGANLAFERKRFIEVEGYGGSKSSSGDDTQLMRKIAARWPNKISFIKDYNASVETSSSENSELFEQRRRWASKIPKTLSFFTVSVATLAWFVHAMLIVQAVYTLAGHNYRFLIIALLIKISAEIYLLIPVMKFMKQQMPTLMIILIQPLYAIYIVVIGAIAPLTNFYWKGRRTR